MRAKRKYQFMIIASVAVFLYVIVTEVSNRLARTYHSYTELKAAEASFLSPEQLADKKLTLLQEKKSLSILFGKGKGGYEQSQTGVFEFLSTCASKNDIHFESLVPIESPSSDQLQEVGFKVDFDAGYQVVAAFVNAVENGEFITRVKKVEIALSDKNGSMPRVSVEGTVYVLTKGFSR